MASPYNSFGAGSASNNMIFRFFFAHSRQERQLTVKARHTLVRKVRQLLAREFHANELDMASRFNASRTGRELLRGG